MMGHPSQPKATMTRRACLVFDSDSQYFACRNLVSHFVAADWKIKFVIVGVFAHAEIDIPGTEIVRIASVSEVCQLPEVMSCDALGAYLTGSKLRGIWSGVSDYFSRTGTRPLLFTGYNGVILRLFEDGLSWRGGYDLISLNSPEDHMKAAAFGDHSTLENFTLMPIIGIDRTSPSAITARDGTSSWRAMKQIVFAEQVLFPKSAYEKFYLYSHLLRIALANPDWQIVIKPRTLPGSETFHRQDEHISDFIRKRFILPINFQLRYEPLDEILRASTVLLSISSTAFFDALGQSVPAYTLSDFGISSAYGTHFFHGSGCTLCLADVTKLSHDLFGNRPSQEWLEFKGFSSRFSPASIVTGLGDLLEAGSSKIPLPAYDTEQRLLAAPAQIPAKYLKIRIKIGLLLLDQSGKSPKTIRRFIARLRRNTSDLIGQRLRRTSGTLTKKPSNKGDANGEP